VPREALEYTDSSSLQALTAVTQIKQNNVAMIIITNNGKLNLPENDHFLGGGGGSDLRLNSGLHACKVGALLLSHMSSPFCDGCFGDRNFTNYLPRLALNCNPPNLSLPSS
jgi:hypothetical protein